MSVQDLISRIDTARSNLQEAKNQVSECSCSTTGNAECECRVESGSESNTPSTCSDSETNEEPSALDRLGGAAVGGLLYSTPGMIIGATRPDLIDNMLAGSVPNAIAGGVGGYFMGGPKGAVVGSLVGWVGGGYSGLASALVDEGEQDENGDEECDE